MPSKSRGLPSRERLKAAGASVLLEHNAEEQPVHVLDREGPRQTLPLLLCHNEADRSWTERLRERIELERFKEDPPHIGVQTLDPSSAMQFLETRRVVVVVVSSHMLEQDWPWMEKSIRAGLDSGMARGVIVPILKDNVTMPGLLGVKDWVDFRDRASFDESVQDLVAILDRCDC